MKKFAALFFIICFALNAPALSQSKIGYVDSDTIMDKLQDAVEARQQLDQLIQEWQGELSRMEREWKSKYDEYEKRKLIMTDQTRVDMEAEMVRMEQKMTEYREKKFGTNGELFQKQDELMKPVQNKVFTAIKKVSQKEDFDFVFDRSGGVLLLYARDKYDLTPLVMKELKIDEQQPQQSPNQNQPQPKEGGNAPSENPSK